MDDDDDEPAAMPPLEDFFPLEPFFPVETLDGGGAGCIAGYIIEKMDENRNTK